MYKIETNIQIERGFEIMSNKKKNNGNGKKEYVLAEIKEKEVIETMERNEELNDNRNQIEEFFNEQANQIETGNIEMNDQPVETKPELKVIKSKEDDEEEALRKMHSEDATFLVSEKKLVTLTGDPVNVTIGDAAQTEVKAGRDHTADTIRYIMIRTFKDRMELVADIFLIMLGSKTIKECREKLDGIRNDLISFVLKLNDEVKPYIGTDIEINLESCDDILSYIDNETFTKMFSDTFKRRFAEFEAIAKEFGIAPEKICDLNDEGLINLLTNDRRIQRNQNEIFSYLEDITVYLEKSQRNHIDVQYHPNFYKLRDAYMRAAYNVG